MDRENSRLIELLEQCSLKSLVPKFQQAGVTAEIFWHLDDEMLSIINLNPIEILRYNTAKANHGAQGNLFELRSSNSFINMHTNYNKLT